MLGPPAKSSGMDRSKHVSPPSHTPSSQAGTGGSVVEVVLVVVGVPVVVVVENVVVDDIVVVEVDDVVVVVTTQGQRRETSCPIAFVRHPSASLAVTPQPRQQRMTCGEEALQPPRERARMLRGCGDGICPYNVSMAKKTVPAGQFKQGCLAILDEVARSHREVLITKRGKPVARLVPVLTDREREEEILSSLRGRAKVLVKEAEFLRPLTREGGWKIGQGR
jgi:prevent-host-death family protein